MLRRKGCWGPLVLCVLLSHAVGCRTYEVWQGDHWEAADFDPAQIDRAAVVMFAPWSEVGGQKIESHGTDETLPRNKTFGEAIIICLQQRGIRIVEQQAVAVAQQEARLILAKQSDVVSTRELAERLGQQLNLDTVFYADSLGRQTYFEFHPKPFGANKTEAAARESQANQRNSITPEDARRCQIVAHHSVGLSLRAVEIATGKIKWVGFRHLCLAEQYDDQHPDALTTFNAVQMLSEKLTSDIFDDRASESGEDGAGKT